MQVCSLLVEWYTVLFHKNVQFYIVEVGKETCLPAQLCLPIYTAPTYSRVHKQCTLYTKSKLQTKAIVKVKPGPSC